MKVILSRKGVDSSAGGFASPLFPDGRMMSIPIPDKRSVVRYRDIENNYSPDRSYAKLVRNLSKGKLTGAAKTHLDPDLDKSALPRAVRWRPLFGQHGAAQSHLHGLDVGAGDIFLFFGWFREVEYYRRQWRFVAGASDLHIIFGWMQVDCMIPADELKQSAKHSWAHYHPHCLDGFTGSNVIYQGRDKLSFTATDTAGAGLFQSYGKELCLTGGGGSRTHWQLPLWMHPEGKKSTLSYHNDTKRWSRAKDCALLKSVARGQEFVLDLDHYPQGHRWLCELFNRSAIRDR